MSPYKLLFTGTVVQAVYSMLINAYVAMNASKTTCTGDTDLCDSVTQDAQGFLWQVIAITSVYNLLIIGFAYLAFRSKNRIMAGVIALYQVIILAMWTNLNLMQQHTAIELKDIVGLLLSTAVLGLAVWTVTRPKTTQ